MCVTPHNLNFSDSAIADTGATSTYLTPMAPSSNIRVDMDSIRVCLPNGQYLSSSHKCTLSLPSFPKEAREAHVLPELVNNSLISIAKLCDSDLTATFTSDKVVIKDKNTVIFEGFRDNVTRLWRLPLQEHQCNNMENSKVTSKAFNFMYAEIGNPAKSTLLQAVRSGYFKSWPGFNVTSVNKYISENEVTFQGNLDQIRQKSNSKPMENVEGRITE